MLYGICFTICVFLTFYIVLGDGFYTLVAPGTIRSQSVYKVILTLHQANKSCQFRVAIDGPSVHSFIDVHMNPWNSKTLNFHLPKLVKGTYKLKISGLQGLKFTNVTELICEDKAPFIIIQSDKVAYCPGELVQYWIIIVDENLRPAITTTNVSIVIIDANRNIVQHLHNVTMMETGVYEGSYQLYEHSILGYWKINVTIENQYIKIKHIEVGKRTMPKFFVDIETSKEIAQQDGVIRAIIHAKYPSGMPVHGKANVSLTTRNPSHREQIFNLTQSFKLKGMEIVEFCINNTTSMIANRILPMQMEAIVEENSEYVKNSVLAYIRVHPFRYRFERIQVPKTFIEHEPLVFKLRICDLYGVYVKDNIYEVKLLVETPIKKLNKHVEKLGVHFKSTLPIEFSSLINNEGIAEFKVLLVNSTQSYYRVRVIYRDVDMPLSSLTRAQQGDVQLPIQINPIKITILTKNPQFGEKLSIQVLSVNKMWYFTYAVVARGNILHSKLVAMKNPYTIILSLKLSFPTESKISFFVFYISHGQLKYNEVNIPLVKQFENFIKLNVPQIALPGYHIDIGLQSMPNSTVGLMAVETSELHKSNFLSKRYILAKLSQYATIARVQLGYYSSPGYISGLITLTNAHFLYKTCVATSLSMRLGMYDESQDSVDTQMSGSADSCQDTFDNATLTRELLSDTTWLWNLSQTTIDEKIVIKAKVPDKMTSWALIGFSINPIGGLAVVEPPKQLRPCREFLTMFSNSLIVHMGDLLGPRINDTDKLIQQHDKDFTIGKIISKFIQNVYVIKFHI